MIFPLYIIILTTVPTLIAYIYTYLGWRVLLPVGKKNYLLWIDSPYSIILTTVPHLYSKSSFQVKKLPVGKIFLNLNYFSLPTIILTPVPQLTFQGDKFFRFERYFLIWLFYLLSLFWPLCLALVFRVTSTTGSKDTFLFELFDLLSLFWPMCLALFFKATSSTSSKNTF